MRRTLSHSPYALLCTTLLLACARERPASDTAAAGATTAAASAQKSGETGGFNVPESVRYDPDLDVFFVSNINGNPSQKDNNGFIARVRADSTSVSTMLVEGGKRGVTLHAPKGMAIVGDTLWVADIDALRGFNRRTGARVRSVNLASQRATFLNDVAVGGDGAIYITDTGIVFDASGGMTHPGENRIFRVSGTSVTDVARGEWLANPNGIAWDRANNTFVLAPFCGPVVQTWSPGNTAPASLASGPGQYDGVEVLADGRVLVSSWADSAVHVIRRGQMTKLVGGVNAPADIGVDTKRGVLAIPRFSDGKVEYYRIP